MRSAIDLKMIFHSHANKNHVSNNGFVLSLVLKVRVFGLSFLEIAY